MMQGNIPKKIFFSLLCAIALLPLHAQNFSPTSLDSLVLWLKADSGVILNGAVVQQWKDWGGITSEDAAQATVANRPSYVASAGPLMNYMPTISFDGSNDILTGPAITGLGSGKYSVFVVAEGRADTSNSTGLFGLGPNLGAFFMYRRATATNRDLVAFAGNNVTSGAGTLPQSGFPYKVFTLIQSMGTGGSKLYLNSTLSGSGTLAAFADNTYSVGRSSGTLDGSISEIIVFKNSLPDSSRLALEQYLYNKYAPPVSLGPDTVIQTSLCPYTISAGPRFTNYLWSNGSTTSNITVIRSGMYSVTATNIFGKQSVDTIQVTLPDINISNVNSIICAGSSVTLTTNYAGGNYTFLWNNGLTQAAISATQAGSYYVTLTDTSAGGCSANSDTITLSIDNFPNVVGLGADTSLCAGNFISLQSPATGWGTLSFNWQPGGSTDSIIPIINSGIYSVSVTNGNGCVGKDTINVTIAGSAPTVNFTGDTLCLGEVYMPFNSSVSNDASPIVNYEWDFGNGVITTGMNPQYAYPTAGGYVVSLKVTTANGCSSVGTRTVLVRQLPLANFTNSSLACLQIPVQFTDQSTATSGTSLVQWFWNFGDMQTSTQQNPQHVYNNAQTYSVTLTVTDNVGCVDTASGSITAVSSAAPVSNVNQAQPANGISLESANVYFEWSASAGAVAFSIIVSTDTNFTSTTVYAAGNANNTNITLAGNQKYFWKVRAYNLCNDSVDSQISSFRIFSPGSQSGVLLWLRADSSVVKYSTTDSVTRWNDIAGANDFASQATPGAMPRLVQAGPLMNYKPAIKFDGSNDVLTGNTLALGAGQYTVFIVAEGRADTTNSAGLFGIGPNLGAFFIYRRATATNQDLVAFAGNNVTSGAGTLPATGFPYKILGLAQATGTNGAKLYINSTQVGTGSLAAFVNNNYAIGRSSGTLDGSIAEVIVYNTLLPDAQRNLVEKYLYDKYAPPVALGPDISVAYSLCPNVIDAGPRFVHYLWNTGDTTRQISVSGTGTYWVRATDIFGRLSSDTINVLTPYRGMNTGDTILCKGNSAVLQPILVNSPYTYLWNNGQQTQAITVTEPGAYVVTVTDTSAAQCFFITDTVFVAVDSFSDVSLLPADTATCIGNTLQLDSNGYNIVSINWSTADTTSLITINGPGVYTVTATDVNQCSVSDAINVTIKGIAPTVNFGVDNVCFGFTSLFTDSSSTVAPDAIIQWQWDFGDMGSSTVQNPAHEYAAANIYPVTLTVVTDSGCAGSITKYTEVYGLPSANFTQLAPVCVGSPANLSDISNAPVGTSIVDWKWVVNGTTVSTQQNASVTFSQQGINPLTLIVTTAQGCSDTIVKNVETFPALLADFEVANVCVGDSSYFFDITPSYSVISRTWAFGDGGNSTLKNPVRKYTQPGVYNVLLTVRNAIGCQDTVRKTVIAASKPIAKFGNLIGCEDGFYTPLDSSTSAQEPINSWQWTIGGFNYNTQAPNRYFATPGTYPVKLRVATETGCSDSITKTVTIHPRPVANFNFTPLYGEAPLNVTFTNLSTGASTYLWQFGDGDNSTLVSPVHTYGVNGNYNVSLTAVSQFGCTNTRVKPYTVIPTDLDFSVDEALVTVTPLPDGSSLAQVVVQGSNLSTRIIEHVGFYVSMGGVGVLAEDWTGTLYTGQILPYTFSAKFVVPAGKGDSYICVTAMSVNSGETELRTDNNAQCIGTTEGIQLMGPLPNPALNQSVLGIILPKHGKVTIDIADVMGQYLVTGEELELPEGRSDYNLPVGQMTAGEYFIRISYNDEKVVRKLVIRR